MKIWKTTCRLFNNESKRQLQPYLSELRCTHSSLSKRQGRPTGQQQPPPTILQKPAINCSCYSACVTTIHPQRWLKTASSAYSHPLFHSFINGTRLVPLPPQTPTDTSPCYPSEHLVPEESTITVSCFPSNHSLPCQTFSVCLGF